MLETPFPFFISKTPGEIPIFGTFLAKKWFFFNLVYFHRKSAFWVRPCLKTSLWRHTLTDFHDFGINGKRRPYPIPWYQTIILWAVNFKFMGLVTTPLGKPCYKKRLGRTRVNIIFQKSLDKFEIAHKACLLLVWSVPPPLTHTFILINHRIS